MAGAQADGGPRWMARGEHDLPSSRGWLTDAEAGRAATLRFTKRRSEFLLRRWVCKHAVAAATGLPSGLPDLARLEVGNRPSGAPYVHLDGAPVGLDVSISDRAGWAVCLVAEDLSRVGCDLEVVEPRSPGFVSDFLTAPERSYVADRSGADRDAAANLIWSAKESALKVLHTGLRRDTRSIEVTVGAPETAGPDAGWGSLELRPVEGGCLPGRWRRLGDFLLTVAADQPLPAPVLLAGSADLGSAVPVHSWLDHPLAD